MLTVLTGKTLRRKIMKEKLTITQIGECVIKEMENLHYSPLTISIFRGAVKHLSGFVIGKTGCCRKNC